MRMLRLSAGTVIAAVALAACNDADRPPPTDDPPMVPVPETPIARTAAPDTTADALWAHLEGEAYWESAQDARDVGRQRGPGTISAGSV